SIMAGVKLSLMQVEAFAAVTERREFTCAACAFGVTPSALSPRILNFEAPIWGALFIRKHAGIELTPAGSRLLAFAVRVRELEHQTLADISGEEYPRTVRIAGYSSVTRSIVIPALAAVVERQPNVNVAYMTRELR